MGEFYYLIKNNTCLTVNRSTTSQLLRLVVHDEIQPGKNPPLLLWLITNFRDALVCYGDTAPF